MKERIVILGAGESGTGSAVLAKVKGYDVFLSDKDIVKEKYKTLLLKYSIDYEEEKHSYDKILDAKIIIKSPGIPDSAEIILKAKQKNIPVISEIEFAGRYTEATTICITGSNGKTTTTLLTYHILKNAGLNVGLAGNVGKSFALQVAEEEYDYYVIELSSFQLDGMFDFKANIAILMNITPDHLDRYNNNFQDYIDSKFRVVQNQNSNDYFIYCNDDEVTASEINKRKINSLMIPFSLNKTFKQGAYLENEELIIKINNTDLNMSILELALQGKHNTYNSMAAGIAGQVLKIRKQVIRESLSDFQGVEHRLEPVLKVHDISFINDSKATNVNSTWYALESTDKPIVWIAGGVDKGNDYAMLKELVRDRVKAIVCLGLDNSKIKSFFSEDVSKIIETKSMSEAVKAAYYLAKKGDSVLLSPACASFDLFDNYEDRGRQFKNSVREL
jgi:UDP-N-acetylmuramoylalanine--D-glutamate ligase